MVDLRGCPRGPAAPNFFFFMLKNPRNRMHSNIVSFRKIANMGGGWGGGGGGDTLPNLPNFQSKDVGGLRASLRRCIEQLGTISVSPGSQSTCTKVCTCMYLTS